LVLIGCTGFLMFVCVVFLMAKKWERDGRLA
jgi:hypothetical protein